MQDAATYQDLAKRYGFEATSPGVLELTRLVARQDSVLDEIAKVISSQPALRTRLLRAANPFTEDEADYEIQDVEQALMRNGIGCALLLAMSTPLTTALIKTFQTMLALKLEPVEVRKALPLKSEHLLVTIGFEGKAVGSVYLRLNSDSAKAIAATILGLSPTDPMSEGDIDDALGELLNISTGNFKSNLCDAGLDCRLSPPRVALTTQCKVPTVPGGGLERMAFRAQDMVIFVDVAVNPWHED